MANRPYYENEKTLAGERSTADKIEQLFDCQLKKMPIKLSLDFMALRSGSAVSFIEVRNRKTKMDAYPTYMVSLYKYMMAGSITQATGLPCFLAVQWSDKLGIVKMPTEDGLTIGWGGLTTRNDPQDMEPMAYIDIDQFKVFG